MKIYVGYTIFLGEETIQVVTQNKDFCIAHMNNLNYFSNEIAECYIQTWENGIFCSNNETLAKC